MQDSALLEVGLPIALAIVMLGLGLTLTVEDFRRIGRAPRAVFVALAIQVTLLPAVAFALVVVFDLAPLLAVGVMLLASSPGGSTANLFSHLFGGDVALNLTLTAVNSVIAVVSVPVITNLAVDYFDVTGELGLQLDKIAQVVAVVLLPVVIGMLVKRRAPGLADRANRPVRIFSIMVLVGVAAGALVAERANLAEYLRSVGVVTALFCVMSLAAGYAGARLARLDERQAIASAMEIGIHNTTMALTIALSVMQSSEIAIPAAVYSIVMYPLAAVFGFMVVRGSMRRRTDGAR
ncbi:bile acid:sodium symporter [Prauserella marina]|uniref:Bile acid:Na+ symporter, BASS family n=1 Tax=Prauserella marina TaxID=530584 RepID=A0A222VZY1_9PSEU|nr:bile acid:sodium symporter [Prauserella marina]PWV80072.1 BASS family bile acid:Na+ symporter [Prauserella marina]SDD83837.1 bile acid:Na+ symporter, BASS family [Prauserella marina]